MSFANIVGKWASETPERLRATYRRSVELLGEEMTLTIPKGGRLPVDTGNLARSLQASAAGMPKTSDSPASGSNLGAVAATLELHQSVWLGYQAVYARRQNYGFVGADSKGRAYNQQGHYFVEGAIANWQNIVNKAVAELRK